MEFKLLQDIALTDLAKTFNRAFSDYVVPLQLSEEQLAKKMKNDGINLKISAGAFEDNELIGFILHGEGHFNGIRTVYNGGTGVIPSKRGNKITEQLYEFVLPALKEAQFEQCLLEVITSNGRAVKVYENLGFERSRELICFKGPVIKETTPLLESVSLNEPETLNPTIFKDFCDWMPSWQNSTEAIERASDDLRIITAEKEEEPVAFIIYNPQAARISQFAVKQEYRNQGFGTLLFQELQKRLEKDISLLNIDAKARNSISFLKSVGLKPYIKQYEMLMKL